MTGTKLQDWLHRPRPHRNGVASLFNYSGAWSVGAAFQGQTQVTRWESTSLSLSFVQRQVWLE